jgi:hypothetical protein
MALKRISPIHPFAFTFVCAMYLYQRAEIIASPDQVVRPFLLMSGLLGILCVILLLVLRDSQWVPILLTVFAVAFFSDPLLAKALGLSILAISAGLWAIDHFVRGRNVEVWQANLLLTVFALLLSGIALGLLVRQLSGVSGRYYRQMLFAVEQPPVPVSRDGSDKPDIYWIILDAYARGDVLKDEFHFDNFRFIADLETLGFTLPPAAYSNYPWTLPSLASTLNMNYISDLMPGLEESRFDWLMTPLVQRSRVRSTLEGLGYQTVSIEDEYGLTNNPTTDFFVRPGHPAISDYEFFLLGTTPLGLLRPILAKFGFVVSNETHREMVLSQFGAAEQIPQLPSPKFAIIHIMAPHPPFVFGPDGGPISPDYALSLSDGDRFAGTPAEYIAGYTGQVQFINEETERLVRTILRSSRTPPIIIIQADHGARIAALTRPAGSVCMTDYFAPLAAYYLPGVGPGEIPADLSAVNLFRVIFNHYFSASLPLLPNRQYVPGRLSMYDFGDVTDRVGTSCAGH